MPSCFQVLALRAGSSRINGENRGQEFQKKLSHTYCPARRSRSVRSHWLEMSLLSLPEQRLAPTTTLAEVM